MDADEERIGNKLPWVEIRQSVHRCVLGRVPEAEVEDILQLTCMKTLLVLRREHVDPLGAERLAQKIAKDLCADARRQIARRHEVPIEDLAVVETDSWHAEALERLRELRGTLWPLLGPLQRRLVDQILGGEHSISGLALCVGAQRCRVREAIGGIAKKLWKLSIVTNGWQTSLSAAQIAELFPKIGISLPVRRRT